MASQGIIIAVAGNGFADSGTSGFSGDGGPATLAALGEPLSVVVDAAGNLFIADFFACHSAGTLNFRTPEIMENA